MGWQLGLSRFIHGFSNGDGAGLSPDAPSWFGLDALAPGREALLLPALIEALYEAHGPHTDWPPRSVQELLDLAGLDHADTLLHLQGPGLPARFVHSPRSRGQRQALLLQGLAALDAGLRAETGALFEGLSPTLRGYALGAFERGELGAPRHEAERFMDCLFETVTFARLNWESEPRLSAGARS